MSIQKTLILLKPDSIEKKIAGKLISRYQEIGLTIRGIKMLQLNDEILSEHYSHITEEPFYPKLAEFMKRTPIIAIIFEGDDAISRARQLLGPTNSEEAPAGTIRGNWGTNSMYNACHASDSPESAEVEIKRFFNDGEVF